VQAGAWDAGAADGHASALAWMGCFDHEPRRDDEFEGKRLGCPRNAGRAAGRSGGRAAGQACRGGGPMCPCVIARRDGGIGTVVYR
jgi:hypothetical protein